MFDPIRKIARAFRAQTTQEREMAYLNGSLDRIDLDFVSARSTVVYSAIANTELYT